MIFKVFSIFDTKARAFLPPFFLPERGQAMRAMGDAINNPEHDFGKHPEDYSLFQLATFDDSTGVFASEFGPELIVTGVQLIITRVRPPEADGPVVSKSNGAN